MPTIRQIVRQLVPPLVGDGLRRMRGGVARPVETYDSYEAAVAAGGTGYTAMATARGTLEDFQDEARRCRESGPGVIDGRSIRQLAALLMVREALSQQPLVVLDLGGQVGTHYQRLRWHLPQGAISSWDVCETAPLVKLAATLAEPGLRFFDSLEAAPERIYDVGFSSGTLQVVPDPADTFRALGARCQWLLLDRLPLGPYQRDRLMLLRGAADAYQVPTPIWFFAEQRWLRVLADEGWEVALRWTTSEDQATFDGAQISYSGLLLKRRART